MKLHTEFINKNRNIPTPYLLIDLDILRNNYKSLKALLEGIEVFYAMKANDHKTVCKTLLKEGAPFEVSSLNEAISLIEVGVKPENIVCFNPIKSPQFLQWMHYKKIDTMAFDSFDEIDKIAKYCPESKVVARILVPDKGSLFPLGNKFGTTPQNAKKMLLYAREKGLKPHGITIHVGSQSMNSKNWVTAIEICKKTYDNLKKNNLTLYLISLGGGLPIQYLDPIPSLSETTSVIQKAKKTIFGSEPHLKFTIEPGRAIVGTAGNMVATVVGKAERKGEQWIYLDVGIYNGLMEITGGFRFNIVSGRKGKSITTTVAGPSCDSFDVIAEHINLPNVKIGDKIFILDVGCYSTVFASQFNGFEIPKTYFLNS